MSKPSLHINSPRAQEYVVMKRETRRRTWQQVMRCRAWKGNVRRCQRRALEALLEDSVREATVLATFEWYDPSSIFHVRKESR